MPQLFEFQRKRLLSRVDRFGQMPATGNGQGDENLVIDERSNQSMSTVVEAKLKRLHQEAVRVFARLNIPR